MPKTRAIAWFSAFAIIFLLQKNFFTKKASNHQYIDDLTLCFI